MKRKRSYGRSTRRVRRRSLRRRVRSRRGRRTGVSTVSMKRTLYGGAWTFSNASTIGFWRYINVNASTGINNFAELAAVFDEYRIHAIKQTYRLRYDNVAAPVAAGSIVQPQAYAHIIVDPDSLLVPSGTYDQANLNAFLENGSVRTVTLNKPFSIYWKPKVYNSLATSVNSIKAPWLPVTNATVAHNGFHMFLQQNNFSTTNSNIILDGFTTVYFKLRGQK